MRFADQQFVAPWVCPSLIQTQGGERSAIRAVRVDLVVLIGRDAAAARLGNARGVTDDGRTSQKKTRPVRRDTGAVERGHQPVDDDPHPGMACPPGTPDSYSSVVRDECSRYEPANRGTRARRRE